MHLENGIHCATFSGGGVAGITTHTLNVLRNTIVKQAKRVSQLLSGHVFEGQCKYQLT